MSDAFGLIGMAACFGIGWIAGHNWMWRAAADDMRAQVNLAKIFARIEEKGKFAPDTEISTTLNFEFRGGKFAMIVKRYPNAKAEKVAQ